MRSFIMIATACVTCAGCAIDPGADFRATLRRGSFRAADAAIARGVDALAVDANGRTALHEVVAANGGTLEYDGWAAMARKLIALGCDVNARDMQGTTPLLDACRLRRDPMIRILVEAGADPNVTDQEGNPALHLFLAESYLLDRYKEDQAETALVLVRAGADPRVKDRKGRTAMDVANSAGNAIAARAIANPDKAVPRTPDKPVGKPALFIMLHMPHFEAGSTEMTARLVLAPADVTVGHMRLWLNDEQAYFFDLKDAIELHPVVDAHRQKLLDQVESLGNRFCRQSIRNTWTNEIRVGTGPGKIGMGPGTYEGPDGAFAVWEYGKKLPHDQTKAGIKPKKRADE